MSSHCDIRVEILHEHSDNHEGLTRLSRGHYELWFTKYLLQRCNDGEKLWTAAGQLLAQSHTQKMFRSRLAMQYQGDAGKLIVLRDTHFIFGHFGYNSVRASMNIPKIDDVAKSEKGIWQYW